MNIIASYPCFSLLSQELIEKYNFPLDIKWSGSHLRIPEQIGKGSIHIFRNRGLQFFRGNWQMKEDTFFSSTNPVNYEKLVDFRISASGEVRSAFLEKQKKYEWDISNINGVRLIIPKKLLAINEDRMLNKFHFYCYDANISRLIQELLALSPNCFEECVKMEWKFIELGYYWLEFLNKKDISRHFFELSSQQLNAIRTAKHLVENNLKAPYTIKILSRKIGLNQQCLKKGFKRLYGHTIRQYIIKLRMEKAKEMVIYQNYPINEICNKLGYSNYGHFANLYQKFHGLSPLQHRLNYFK